MTLEVTPIPKRLRPQSTKSDIEEFFVCLAQRRRISGVADVHVYVQHGGLHAKLVCDRYIDTVLSLWATELATWPRPLILLGECLQPPLVLEGLTNILQAAREPASFLAFMAPSIAYGICLGCEFVAEQPVSAIPAKGLVRIPFWFDFSPDLPVQNVFKNIVYLCNMCYKPCPLCGVFPTPKYDADDIGSRRPDHYCKNCRHLILAHRNPPAFGKEALRRAARKFGGLSL